MNLVDKMCNYEMASIVEDTKQTRICPQGYGRTDRRTDNIKTVYPPFNFVDITMINIKIIMIMIIMRVILLIIIIITIIIVIMIIC